MPKRSKDHGEQNKKFKKPRPHFEKQLNNSKIQQTKRFDNHTKNPFRKGFIPDAQTKRFHNHNKNPFRKGFIPDAQPAEGENKRQLVKNEVLEYLEKAEANKPWKQKVNQIQTDVEDTCKNPFRPAPRTTAVTWEKFDDKDANDQKSGLTFKDLSSNEKFGYKKVISKCSTKSIGGVPTLANALNILRKKKKKLQQF